MAPKIPEPAMAMDSKRFSTAGQSRKLVDNYSKEFINQTLDETKTRIYSNNKSLIRRAPNYSKLEKQSERKKKFKPVLS